MLCLASLTELAFGAAPISNKKLFSELEVPQPTETGKIEVVEFFWYSCPHCALLEPLLQQWEKELPADVLLRRVPTAFNAGMKPSQHLFYTLEAMGRLDLHSQVYQAVNERHIKMTSRKDILAWATQQNLDEAKFTATFDSFGVKTKVARADQMTTGYRVQATPTIGIAGRFTVTPTESGGYQQTINQAAVLVNETRISRTKP